MEHCHQCRADAVGLLGEDRSAEFSKDKFADVELDDLVSKYDLASRHKFKKSAELFQSSLIEYKHRKNCKIAVTSFDRESIDSHFGSAQDFVIYEVFEEKVRLLEIRKANESYCIGADNCSDANPIDSIVEILKDCKYLLTAKIGDCPQAKLNEIGIIIRQDFANMQTKEAINTVLELNSAVDSSHKCGC